MELYYFTAFAKKTSRIGRVTTLHNFAIMTCIVFDRKHDRVFMITNAQQMKSPSS